MRSSLIVQVNEASQVGEARRVGLGLAKEIDLNEERRGNIAILISEVCTNIVKHGGGGEIIFQALQEPGRLGLEILAYDHGQGISDLPSCMRDGHSTAGTVGGGLGALSRLSDFFEIYTEPGRGTVVV